MTKGFVRLERMKSVSSSRDVKKSKFEISTSAIGVVRNLDALKWVQYAIEKRGN